MSIRKKIITIAIIIFIISASVLAFTIIEMNRAKKSMLTFNKEFNKYIVMSKINKTTEKSTITLINNLGIAIMISFATIISLIFLTILISIQLFKRIKIILDGIKTFQEGDLSYRIKEITNDEAGMIAQHLNNMADQLSKSEGTLKKSLMEEKNIRIKLEKQQKNSTLLKEIMYATLRKWDIESLSNVVLSQLEQNKRIDYGMVAAYKNNKIIPISFSPKSQDFARIHGIIKDKEIDLFDASILKYWAKDINRKSNEFDFFSISDKTFEIKREFLKMGIKNLIAIPILSQERIFGFIFVGKQDHKEFSEEEKMFLHDLCDYLALAMQNLETHSGLIRTLEELKKARAVMEQQERLIALGNMSSGIAHDINNSLSPIVGFSDLLLLQKDSLNETAIKYITYIKNAAEDVVETLKRLRDFYRKSNGKETLALININEIVKQTIALYRSKWKDEAEKEGIKYSIKTEFDEGIPEVFINKEGFQNVMNNLFINAIEAMENGGIITIKTGKENNRFYLEVSDTGIGMDDETVKRAVEPFYSTKGESGTGLGLSQVYGFVKRYNGKLDIKSIPNKGTTVRIDFPIVEEEGLYEEKLITSSLEPKNLTILTIDDDAILRLLLKEMLQNLGHNVVVGKGGRHGIELFKEHQSKKTPIDLVITDLGMPDVNGKIVAEEIKSLSPDTPVILLTGWGERFTSEENIPEQIDAILSKPPRLHEIRHIIAKTFSVNK